MIDVLALVEHVLEGGNGWTARCPAHDDQRNSLSIGKGDDDRWLLKCHAGCSFNAILEALELDPRDLFPSEKSATPAAVYPYLDERGVLLYEVVRFVPKNFRQRAADGTWSVKGIRKVVYRLPELHGKKTVYVTEGEADANRLWDLQLPATTNAGGAGKWHDEYAHQLQAAGVRNVVIIPDSDAPGHAHGLQVARSCHDAGLIVKLVPLPGLTKAGDVRDFLATRTREDLVSAVQATAIFTATVGASQAFTLISQSDLLAEPDEREEWIVDRRIRRSGSNLFVSPPKVGKTTLCMDLALQVARGRPFLGWRTTPGVVWYLALQEGRAIVKSRLRALGATSSDPIQWFIGQTPTTVVPQMETRAREERPVLIIVDMLANILRVKDFNDYAAVTSGFDPLLQLSRETGAALLLLHHGSAHQYRDGLDAVLGSTALSGCVDNVFILKRDGAVRSLSTIQRSGEDLESTVLEFDKASGRSTLGQSKAVYDQSEMQRQMLAVMQASPTPVPESLIQANLAGRKQDMVKVLRYLVGTKQVARSGGGKRGDPYVYRFIENTGSRYIENKREPETKKSLDQDPSKDLDLFTNLRSPESFLVPDACPDETFLVPNVNENDPSKLAISPDKHWSDSGSQRSESAAEATDRPNQGETERVQAEGDARFRRGWK